MNPADLEHMEARPEASVEARASIGQRTRRQDALALEFSSVGQVILARIAGHAATLRRVERA